jgi:hypothetical protein
MAPLPNSKIMGTFPDSERMLIAAAVKNLMAGCEDFIVTESKPCKVAVTQGFPL